MPFMKFLILLVTLSVSNMANALETIIVHNIKTPISDYDFEGIIKLSNCSGALVKFAGQPMTSKAVVLTNGHCFTKSSGGMLGADEVIYNKPFRNFITIFNKNMLKFHIKATKIIYATVTKSDIALLELSETYETVLEKYKIESFSLDSVRPLEGVDIDIVSGYWETGYRCTIDTFIFNLKEGDWIFTDSIRFTDECKTKGGTSGSPVVSRGTRNVIGINNTINENAIACAMNNPCEISEDGKIESIKDKKYGQQTYTIYSCLSPDFNIDLSLEGCVLPRPQN